MHDVIVIGGGPVGSRVAFKLAEYGCKTMVIERKESLEEPVCCTGIIGMECVRRFDIEESVIYRQFNSAGVYSPSGNIIRLWRKEPQACIVNRSAFNVFFAARASERGAEYLLGSRVTKIQVGDNGVRVESAGSGGGSDVFEARAAVIATGFGGSLVEELGLGKVGDFAGGAQAEVEVDKLGELEVYLGRQAAPGFFAWLAPTSPGRALVGLLSRQRSGYYLKKLMTSLAEQGKIANAEAGFYSAGVSLGPLPRTYTDRVLVVGSAAGQVKPTTGGGIYYGLLCADIAADNLRRGLENGNLRAAGLADYDREWKKTLSREIRIGHWGRKLFELLSDRQIERIFNLVESNGIDKALSEADDLSFDWHGKALLRLIAHRVLSGTITAMKLPIPLIKR